jgi:glycine/D-amino acid oxidase-like deaminating enzyme
VLAVEAQAALAAADDAPQGSAVREAWLSLDVPQTPAAAEPFPAWHLMSKQLCDELDAAHGGAEPEERGQVALAASWLPARRPPGAAAGARLVLDAFEVAIERAAGLWRVRSRAGDFEAPVLVNATGAWADRVARQAGVPTVGLQPMRRTAVTLPAPSGLDIRAWPLVIDVDEQFYFKPDAGQLLLSPANEDPMDPCDVAPDEMDIAIAVDRFETATSMRVRKLNHRWAGLRSFVHDRSPVVGYDSAAECFFWLAGQGGYGIQMAPSLARTAAALLQSVPAEPAPGAGAPDAAGHAGAPDHDRFRPDFQPGQPDQRHRPCAPAAHLPWPDQPATRLCGAVRGWPGVGRLQRRHQRDADAHRTHA